MYWKAICIPNTIMILEKCNSKSDWKTLCCCYVWWRPTSNICNLSFAKSRKDHYLSKRSKYRIIYCHKITAFDKKEKRRKLSIRVFQCLLFWFFVALWHNVSKCHFWVLHKKGSKGTYLNFRAQNGQLCKSINFSIRNRS